MDIYSIPCLIWNRLILKGFEYKRKNENRGKLMKSSNLIKEDRIGFLIFHMFVIAFVLFLKSVVTFPNDALEMKFLEYLLMGVYIYTFLRQKFI